MIGKRKVIMESFMTSSPSLHTEIQLEENSGGSYEEMFAKAMEAWHRKDYATSFPAFKMLADSGYSKAYGYLGIAYGAPSKAWLNL